MVLKTLKLFWEQPTTHYQWSLRHPVFSGLPTTNGACDIPYFRDYPLPMELATSRIFGTTNYHKPWIKIRGLAISISRMLWLPGWFNYVIWKLCDSTNRLTMVLTTLKLFWELLPTTNYQWSLRHPVFSGLPTITNPESNFGTRDFHIANVVASGMIQLRDMEIVWFN